MELRTQAGTLANDVGSVEAIRVRVLVRGSQPDLEAVRVRSTRIYIASSDCYRTESLAPAALAHHSMKSPLSWPSAKCYTDWSCSLTYLHIRSHKCAFGIVVTGTQHAVTKAYQEVLMCHNTRHYVMCTDQNS